MFLTNKGIFILVLIGLQSCSPKFEVTKESGSTPQNITGGQTMDTADSQESFQESTQPSPNQSLNGKVLQTMDASKYTYVQLENENGQFWVAAPTFSVKVGDQVQVIQAVLMKKFNSQTLNRSFDEIYFAAQIVPITENEKMIPTQLEGQTRNEHTIAGVKKIESAQIPKAQMRIEEIYKKSSELVGQKVTISGKVVKFNEQILGKNWAHIQDGTGSGEEADLTITTQATVKVGDLVKLTGTLNKNKDFGAGYFYPVIIEDAVID